MGLPMCSRLLSAGANIFAYDTLEANVDPLCVNGATKCTSLGELAANVSIIISMIPNDDVLLKITQSECGIFEHANKDKIFIDMSTISPQTSSQVAKHANELGINYIRAPVSGSTGLAEKGALTIIASGHHESYTSCEKIFLTLGTKLFYLGSAEQARYLKLVLNLMIGCTGAVLAEALALGTEGGLDWAQMIDVISSSAVASPYIQYNADALKARDFSPMFSVGQMQKDMNLVTSTARDVHVPTFIGNAVQNVYNQTSDAGYTDDNMTATIKWLETQVKN